MTDVQLTAINRLVGGDDLMVKLMTNVQLTAIDRLVGSDDLVAKL